MDIVYAVGIAPVKLDRIAGLIKKGAGITLVLDSPEQVRFVAARAREYKLDIPVLIELDCDGHRAGVGPEDRLLLEIGHRIDREKGVRLGGVLTHAGAAYACRTVDEIRALAETERAVAVRGAEILRQNGLPCPMVSVGSTPTARFADNLAGVTEVRAGVFLFYDLVMVGLGVCDVGDIAVSVLASVIGHQKSKGWTITDGGWTALSSDRGSVFPETDPGYGTVCDVQGEPMADVMVLDMNQEHGVVAGRGTKLARNLLGVGSVVRILPNHACATGAMHDRYYVVDGTTEIVDVWPRVNGW